MALIKCPKCKHEISDTTKKCIHCGTRLKEKKRISKKKVTLLIILIVLSITIAIITIIKYNQSHNNTDTIQNKENINIKDKTNSTNNEDDVKEEIQNNDDDISSTTNNDNQQQDNDTSNTSNNTKNNSTTTNKDTNNNTSSNNNTPQKIIIDATENKNCPSGYEFKESLSSTGRPCQKMNIVNGTITYYCLLNNQTLEGDKCKSISTSQPVGGQCYNGATLNNGVCETITYTNASTRLTCPSGYSKYSDTQCYGWLYESANISYSCPSSYTLNGNKCEK